MKFDIKESQREEKRKLHCLLRESLKSFKGSIAREEKDYIKDVIRSYNRDWIRDKSLQNQINDLIRETVVNREGEECRFARNYNNVIHEIYKSKKINDVSSEVIGIDETNIQVDNYEKVGNDVILNRTRYSIWGHVFKIDFINGRDSTKKSSYDNGRLVEESNRIDYKYYGEFDYGRWQTVIYKSDRSVLKKLENDLGHMIEAKCTKDGILLWKETVEQKDDISTLNIYKKDGSEVVLIRDGINWILEAKRIKKENGKEKIIWSMEGLDKKINEHRFDGDNCRLIQYESSGEMKDKVEFPIEDYQFQFWKLTGFDLASNRYRDEEAYYYKKDTF